MPANLPPEYHKIEAELRTARTPEEKIAIYERLIRVIPHHKGTDKLIAMYRQKIAKAKAADGILCLGALIRGDTPHFDYLSAEVTKGLAQIAMEDGLPVAFGILTVDTVEQAIERAGTKAGNKGYDAAFSLVETMNLVKESGLR